MRKRTSEQEKQLTHRIHTRISREKFEELSALLKQSRSIKTLSALLRHILEDDKIEIVHRDTSGDFVLSELAAVRRELHAIGVNINQVTHRFHTEDTAEGRLLQVLELTGFYQQAELKLSEVIAIISRISRQWLPE